MSTPTPALAPAAPAPARPVLEHLNSAATHATAPSDVPSVFETLASEELRDLVQPAFRYVLAFFAQRYPRYLLRLINSHEEVYAGFLAAIEAFHLHAYNSTFTDHFYGLEFKSLTPHPLPPSKLAPHAIPTTTRPSRRQKISALAFIVGIPYIRSKAQDLYERLGTIDPDTDTDNSFRITPTHRLTRLFARVFRKCYPWINLAYELGTVTYDIGFAFGKGWGWRWWMRLIGIEVVRVSADGQGRPGILSKSTNPILRQLNALLTRLPTLHPLASTLLLLKFLQWWYSPASPRLTARKAAEERARVVVPPPRIVLPAKRGQTGLNPERADVPDADAADDDDDASDSEESIIPGTPDDVPYGTCPICLSAWANPTITPTGYTGCYLCLYRCVERDGKCPVTGGTMRVDELRKVAG
ncbi:hypothetical protein NliqN6_3952 [Naganishia liquefaciens]|uniref:Peroxisome assembly protein 12 n=1 Tax=Naganishia liquefaciens TaxID=104408 RepID=A0A8H3YFB7_9TREE|nr:hypothetical protein NliqN6_3952 [Naganishia liquefaciens]